MSRRGRRAPAKLDPISRGEVARSVIQLTEKEGHS